MFKCQRCNNTQPERTRSHRLVVEREEVNYPYRRAANYQKIDGQWEHRDDKGGTGWQIVKTMLVCSQCLVTDTLGAHTS